MGFDNECILNIQSLAGEYFCPVCRTLVYPHEAIQTQCTHLYCKPCLSYVVSSTQACPYDGYLVTEAGSKPLMESNKALAETIGKTTVHCLYHRSGCVWQGPLSECTTHCSGCAFGNSPVVCNRCGIQIVHRQVQEHAQTCNVNGTSTQPQTSEAAQDAASSGAVPTDQSKIANQAVAPPLASQPQASHTAAAQNLNQPATSYPLPQVMAAPVVPTAEHQYYQHYQQYYQQYPGYDPYQQAYQQYYPYHQPAQQIQQPPPQPQSQAQVQQQVQAPMPQVQPQAQNQAQTQGQGQPQPQTQPQAQSQIPANGQPQPLYPQAVVVTSSQNQGQANSQPQGHPGQPVAHGHIPVPSYSQVQPHIVQSHAQPPQYQQPPPQMHHPQPTQVPPFPQTQPQTQPQPYSQPPSHFHSQPPPQLQPINPQYPPASHPLYPSQPHQHAPPQQHPMQVQPPSGSLPPQFPPPPPSYMRPLQPSHMFPPQQRPVTHQVQQPMPPPYIQQPQAFPGQTPGQLQGQPHHAGLSAHQNLQVRPQVPPQQMQQPSPALPHGMPPQSYVGRPAMLNQGGQPQQYPQSSGSAGVAPPARPLQFGSSQPFVSQSNVNLSNQQYVYPDQQRNEYAPPSGGDQTFERRVEQEGKSPSLKKSEPVINEVKPEAGMADEFKREGGQRKDEALTKDAVSELHQAQGGVLVKEESTDGALEDHSLGQKKMHDSAVPTTDSAKQGEISGSFSQSQTPQGQIGEASGGFPSKGTEQSSHLAPITEQGRSTHPPLPYGPPGQQQRPVAPKSQSAPNIEQTMGQSPSHFRPPGHGYLPHGPHPGDQFQPPGPNQPPPFHPEVPSGGPNSFANSRGYEPHGRISRMSQGDPFGPPPPHGPDGLRHHGPMESDMYQNQRPSHFDSRRQDSHLPGNLDRGPYRPPYGAESNSTRMNGAPPPGFGDEKFRTSDSFPMPPNRHREESFKQFPGPPHLGREDSPKFGSRPSGGYGMDGPSRFHEKEPHGYGYDAGQRLPPYHLNESGGRPLPANIHDNRGRFDNNRQNPDFLGPMHGFGRHHMDHLPPTSPGNPFGGPHNIDVDGRNMERQSFGERFPMGPPGHMHRGEFDGPGKPMNGEPFGPRDLSGRGEPGFGPFHDYGRLEEHGPGGFSHQSRFGEAFGSKSARPHLDEPVFRNSYSRQGFPSDGGFYAGGPDSFDPLMKRKTFSMGWCRICKVDCESVEGLDMHGQTREHQRMSMDMVISIKKKNAKRQKTSIEREEGSKYRI
ncbi:putative non-specific serine/threonine protein kinase transcription factor C2H2 family [Helianthus anomalus]